MLAATGCVGSSLEQTPLPDTPPQAVPAVPQTAASADAQSEASADDDDAPVSQHAAGASPPAAATTGIASPHYACRRPAPAGRSACAAIVATAADASRVAHGCAKSVPYCASDLAAAYGLTAAAASRGKGEVVAIVDAYGYPGAAGDLAVYRKKMGLPACTVSSGCLRIVNQQGRASPLPRIDGDPNEDWRIEQAADLDVVSAICPNCKLRLVQAKSEKDSDLAAAANAAVAQGAVAVANPYFGQERRRDAGPYRHPGHALVASAADDGTGARMPCSFQTVVCVSGTTLLKDSSPRGWSESAWHPSGGCSAIVPKPSWQRAGGCRTRVAVDVAALADPATGVAVYDAAAGGWQQIGGTGVSAVLVAAVFALGPDAARVNAPQWIWRHGGSDAFHRIGADPGYDGATGWGTPNGTKGL